MKSEIISSSVSGELHALRARAVVLDEPHKLCVRELDLTPPGPTDVVVEVEWSGISTGTERLLWSGQMPMFPGMGYPLVPGYESVGRITQAGSQVPMSPGTRVFVSGASCFDDVRGLFGGAASRLVVPADKVIPIDETLEQRGILLALAATAVHAFNLDRAPELIVGHGVLGRLLARVAVAKGADAPMVWEIDEARCDGAVGYDVCHPEQDTRTDYTCAIDVSGAPQALDTVMAHLARQGVVVLAGFYSAPVSFAFPPAFMREASIRIAAEWQPNDLLEATELVSSGALSLDGLITHQANPHDAPSAYRTAFNEPACLKMILDWREVA
ncbi:MAG: chlorophyll synthesis pathway protein BchC [Pseudomonadota bacterium]